MKIIKIKFLILCGLLSTVTIGYTSSVDNLAKSAVFIQEQVQAYEIQGNKKYELWLKDNTTPEEKPKLNTYYGTGFLTAYNGKIYLVTAAHIAKEISIKARILWNTASRNMRSYTFEFLQKQIPGSKWFFHPTADIAVHPFGLTEKADHIALSEKMYWDKNKNVPLGTKVYIFGYPLSLGVKEILSPISKKAEIASWLTSIYAPNIDPDLLFVLLDEDLAEGYSGSPVFTSPEPRLGEHDSIVIGGEKLLGIQSRTISDKTGGKISLVVPIFYLKEIFDSKDFKDFEEGIK